MSPITSAPNVGTALHVPPVGGLSGASGEVPFSSLLSNLLNDVNQQQQQVGVELERLTSGESHHVHDLVVSVAKADLSLRMALEVRDQVIASYQEVMRMQM